MLRKISFALFALICITNIAKAESDALRFVYYHDFEPYSMSSDAQVHGIFVTLSKHIMEDVLNIKTKHFGMPWARAQQLVKNGYAEAFITVPTEERKEFMTCTLQPVLKMEMKIFVELSHPNLNKLKQVTHFSELDSYRIIDYFGNNWGQNEFEGLVVTRVTNIDQALGMLHKGRADIAIFDSTLGRYKLMKLSLSDDIAELPNALANEGMHLCILKTSSYAQIIPEIDNYLRSEEYHKYRNNLLSDFIH